MPILLALLFLAQVPMPFANMGKHGATPPPTPTPSGTPTPGTVVITPVINPDHGNTPQTVTITCATSGATIFYTLSPGGTNPTHSGATPLGSTLIYHGSFSTGSGVKEVRALGYKLGLTDSAVAFGSYDTPF